MHQAGLRRFPDSHISMMNCVCVCNVAIWLCDGFDMMMDLTETSIQSSTYLIFSMPSSDWILHTYIHMSTVYISVCVSVLHESTRTMFINVCVCVHLLISHAQSPPTIIFD